MTMSALRRPNATWMQFTAEDVDYIEEGASDEESCKELGCDRMEVDSHTSDTETEELHSDQLSFGVSRGSGS